MPKERKQNVFFYQAAGNKEPKCLKLVLCQVGLHVVTTQFHLLKQARFQCLNDDVASVWLNPPPKTKQFLSGTKITYKDWTENDMGKKEADNFQRTNLKDLQKTLLKTTVYRLNRHGYHEESVLKTTPMSPLPAFTS